jgi:cell division protein FtsN
MKTSFSQQQRGGTLLGLIIGALIGLGGALAVAVYVTKVPVPFLNKIQLRSAETDAAEAKKNKDWDPNISLAGKNPVKPAPVASDVVGTAPTPGVAASGAAKPNTSSDPLGDLAKAKSEDNTQAKGGVKSDAKPDPVSSTPGPDPFNYFIQAGAFRTPEDAEQQRAKLLLMGFQAKITEREQSGRTVYRVRLGPFDKKEDADKAKEKLDGNSVETALVRVQR